MSGERCAADTANDGMGRVIAYRVALSGWSLRHLWPIARLFFYLCDAQIGSAGPNNFAASGKKVAPLRHRGWP